MDTVAIALKVKHELLPKRNDSTSLLWLHIACADLHEFRLGSKSIGYMRGQLRLIARWVGTGVQLAEVRKEKFVVPRSFVQSTQIPVMATLLSAVRARPSYLRIRSANNPM
jgi:hypothetical protein